MPKPRFLARTTTLAITGATFFRESLFTIGEGDTLERCIFWADHWTPSTQGWGDQSPNNSWIQSVTFTQGPDTEPPVTPPQPTGNPNYPGILWWGSLPLTFVNWNIGSGSSTNNSWITTPAEGIETKGKRLVGLTNFGDVWYQFAQYRHNASDPFNLWSTRVSMFIVILRGGPGLAQEREDYYVNQVEERNGQFGRQ